LSKKEIIHQLGEKEGVTEVRCGNNWKIKEFGGEGTTGEWQSIRWLKNPMCGLWATKLSKRAKLKK